MQHKVFYNGKLVIVSSEDYKDITIYYDKALEREKLELVRKAVRDALKESRNEIKFTEVPITNVGVIDESTISNYIQQRKVASRIQ